MAIEKELLDQLLAGRDPNEVFSRNGLVDDLKKALSERILSAEPDAHLDEHREAGAPANRRNGSSRQSVLTGTSKLELTIPRDRSGTFDPRLIAKYQRRFPDFDDKIISMYARGMACARSAATWRSPTVSRCRPTWSRQSPMPCWRTWPNGRTGRSRRSTRWSFSTPSG